VVEHPVRMSTAETTVRKFGLGILTLDTTPQRKTPIYAFMRSRIIRVQMLSRLDRLTAADLFERKRCAKLVTVRSADDGLGIVVLSAVLKKIGRGLPELVLLQKCLSANSVAFRNR
jgi:hypothetical protein